MAEGMNRTTLIGNLGSNPELRYTQNAKAVLKLRLATTEVFFNQEKERQQRTEWHHVVLWGKRAEALNRVLSKGDRICVEGRIQTRSWQTEQGEKRYITEIIATNVILLGGRRENAPTATFPSHNKEVDVSLTNADECDNNVDNELPF